MKRIPIAGPWITDKEVSYVADAARNAWYEQANVYHERFERGFASYIGVRHAVALPSCTAAIHLALLALGVGPGDEVIVPDITWIASAAPVTYVGAPPVLADIDARSWCLSAASFEECVTPRTKAVIPVDLYGNVCDWGAISDVARRYGVAVIEDAAEAVGGEYHGRKAGSCGDVGVFSFHGSKTLTTGEGGMLVTDREDIRERVLVLRDHGRRPGDKQFWNTEVAHKYKMSALQAALGLAQLERINELLARKDEIFGWYQERLGGVPSLRLNWQAPDTRSTWWMVTVAWEASLGVDKDELAVSLAADGIDTRPFFRPLSSFPAYEGLASARQAKRRSGAAYTISPTAINLPSGLDLCPSDVERVSVATLNRLFSG